MSRGWIIFSGNNGKDTIMAKLKKRVEWAVRLHRYNLKEGNNLHPRVVLRGTLSLEDLAQRVEFRTRGLYKAEETVLVAHKLMEAAIDALVEGYALNTSLGRLTPVVTGMWSFARLSPEARAQNKASVSYALSHELKKAFSDPLFHDEVPPDRGPDIYLVHDMESNSDNRRITPGGYIWVKGRFLLMNGDSPERGVELLEAETGRVVRRYTAEELAPGATRSHLVLRLPDDLPDGLYRLAVTSQCTTKPTPLKKPVRRVANVRLRVGEEPAEEGTAGDDGRTTTA